MMCDIFISHIHEDEIAAYALTRFLSTKLEKHNPRGLAGAPRPQIFISSNEFEIKLGDDWLQKIRAALISSKLVIALFSPQAIMRPWVNFEAGGAWFSNDKKLIPLCIGDLEPTNLAKPYSNIQGANLREPSSAYYLFQSAFTALQGTALAVPPPPPFGTEDPDVQELIRGLERWEETGPSR